MSETPRNRIQGEEREHCWLPGAGGQWVVGTELRFGKRRKFWRPWRWMEVAVAQQRECTWCPRTERSQKTDSVNLGRHGLLRFLKILLKMQKPSKRLLSTLKSKGDMS